MTTGGRCTNCRGPLPQRRAAKGLSTCRACSREHNRLDAAQARAEAQADREKLRHLPPATRAAIRDVRRGQVDAARYLTDPGYAAGCKLAARDARGRGQG